VAACATAPAHLAVQQLPSVELTTLDGRPAQLQRAVDGRVAVIALWAPWCEGCVAELEALTRLHQRASARGAVVLAVAVGERRSTVAEFVVKHSLPFPQLVDEQFRFATALGETRIPSTLVVDGTGRIVFSGGALDAPALAALRATLDRPTAGR
jgi:peroxiredoxin